jgi:hypothetical protein
MHIYAFSIIAIHNKTLEEGEDKVVKKKTLGEGEDNGASLEQIQTQNIDMLDCHDVEDVILVNKKVLCQWWKC